MPTQKEIESAYYRRQLELIRISNSISRADASAFRVLASEIRALLGQHDLPGVSSRSLRTLMLEVDRLVDDAVDSFEKSSDEVFVQLPQDESEWVLMILGFVNKPDLPAIRLEGVVALGFSVDQLREQFSRWLKQRVQSVIRDASITGSSAIATLIGEGLPRTPSGVIGRARAQLSSLNDTMVQAIANHTRHTVYMYNKVKVLRWQSVMDSRTSEGCAIRHGLLYGLDFRPINHDIVMDRPPPRHFNCRSMLIPELRSGSDIPSDGETAPKAFEGWLASLSDDERTYLFGKGRYELWARGDLTKQDLLSQEGRVLTLAELRLRYGLAP